MGLPPTFATGEPPRVASHSVIAQKISVEDLERALRGLQATVTHDLQLIDGWGLHVSGTSLTKLDRRIEAAGGTLKRTGAVRASAATVHRVADDFESASFSGSTGTRPWAGSWTEVEPLTESKEGTDRGSDDGPEAGHVQVANGTLVLSAPDRRSSPSAARALNLAGASAVSLSFDFETGSGVDSSDEIAVEISTDGGATYTLLETIGAVAGATLDSRVYDISPYATRDTTVRFRVAEDYDGRDELFRVHELEITYVVEESQAEPTGSRLAATDDFSSGFEGGEGSLWAGPWLEVDPGRGGADSGHVQVRRERLRLSGSARGLHTSATRTVAANEGTRLQAISFDWQTGRGVDPSDAVALQISTAGRPFATLREFSGLTGRHLGHERIELPLETPSTLDLRFAVVREYADSEERFFVDNLEVTAVEADSSEDGLTNDGTSQPHDADEGAGPTKDADSADEPEQSAEHELFPCDITQDSKSWWYNPYTCFPSVVGAHEVHEAGYLGTGVSVAFLDSGLFPHHNILHDADGRYRLLAQYDAMKDHEYAWNLIPTDEHGHGGHVSSVALSSAQADNGRYNGIAPNAQIVSVRVFDQTGTGSYADVIRGIDWAVKNQARYGIGVLNLSMSADARSSYWDDPLNQAVMAAWEAGIFVVASAGNGGPDPMTIGVPGNNPYVLTVGAMTDNYTPGDPSDDVLASFSASGPTREGFLKPEVVAPGGHVLGMMSNWSTLAREHPEKHDGGFYFSMSGTSQAAAVASGVAALVLEAHPGLTPDQVKQRIVLSARPALDRQGKLAYSILQQGAGLIDAGRAVFDSPELEAMASSLPLENVQLDVSADLAGERHFYGPVQQDDAGNYVLLRPDGTVWGDAFVWSDGFVWSDAFVWSDGFVWSDAFVWSDGFVWNDAFVWADGYVWSEAFVRSEAFVWSDGFVWSDAFVWSDFMGHTAGVNVWVEDQ